MMVYAFAEAISVYYFFQKKFWVKTALPMILQRNLHQSEKAIHAKITL